MPSTANRSRSSSKSQRTTSLREYKAKRNFSASPEPSGSRKKKNKKRGAAESKKRTRIFCVQKHLASHLHYDFRLEHNGVLLSWAVPKGPSLNPKDKRLAMKVEDHPFDYKDFEGVIPEGYGAGIVMVWDEGTWSPEAETGDVDAALKKGQLKFSLDGVKLKGSWVLVRTRGSDSRTWLLIKHRDEWAGEVDIIKLASKSVKSFGDFEDILAKDKPDIWLSHKPPVKGGETGAMLRKIIARAMKLKDNSKGRTKSAKRTSSKDSRPKR